MENDVSASKRWAEPVTGQSLVVIAASAGGLKAVTTVLSSLPGSFPAPIAVVQHRGEQHPQLLPELLDQCTNLNVRHARNGDLLEPGTVYVCPPGTHMTAEHCIRLVEGPKLDFVRPSADLMFRSVARSYGDRAIGVVLSGSGSDGAVGCLAISEAGGTVIAQDPATSDFPGMPDAAVGRGRVDLVLPVDQIGEALRGLVDDLGSEGARPLSRLATPAWITVLLADDHRIILDGLRTLLWGEEGIDVVGEAEDGRTAVQLTGELSPDVVVMDIGMPDLNGIEATQRIKRSNPRTSVVALSARADARVAARIMEAGATGFLCKNAAFSELALAIRSVAAQVPYMSPPVAKLLAACRSRDGGGGSVFVPLTAEERELVQLMAEGKASHEIARLLGLSLKTVDAHHRRVMEKLGVDNLAGLTRYAIREGLTSVDL